MICTTISSQKSKVNIKNDAHDKQIIKLPEYKSLSQILKLYLPSPSSFLCIRALFRDQSEMQRRFSDFPGFSIGFPPRLFARS